MATFDCRISQLPKLGLVIDYFRWRNEDAARNAPNSWCYWTLCKDGQSEQQTAKRLLGLPRVTRVSVSGPPAAASR